VLTPGPVFNTIGQVDGKDAIVISGNRTFPTEGALDMTTVSEFGGAEGGVNVAQAVMGWASPTRRVVPRETIYPESESHAQAAKEKAEAFATSQSHAISAALRQLGLPVRTAVVVSSVEQGAPAQDQLRAGDHITSIDGRAVAAPQQVVDAVRQAAIGTEHVFDVVRAGTPLTVKVKSGSRPDDPTTSQDESTVPFVGIGIDTLYSGDFDVEFTIERVGGPSAGMMFALGLVDKLTPGPLTGGRVVAGTGTIEPDGTVGAIGGIAQKMAGARSAGAELFLAPQSNCEEILGHIPDGLTVTPVSTLAEAVSAIENYTAGQPLPTCR
jgi:PDZ domain-containing protein